MEPDGILNPMDNDNGDRSSQSLEDYGLNPMELELMLGRNIELPEFVNFRAASGLELPSESQDIAGYLPVDRDELETGLVAVANGANVEGKSYSDIMLNYAFKTDDYTQKLVELYYGKTQSKGPCRKVIQGKKGYCYRCLDCQRNNSSVICQQCFDKSNHKGHRVFKEDPDGVCDCGDENVWKPSGNCCDHTGFVSEDNALDEDLKQRIEISVKKGCWLPIQFFERSCSIERSNEYIRVFIEDVVETLNALCQKYFSLIPVIGNSLITPIKTAFKDSSNFIMYHSHDCHGLPQSQIVNSQTCGCSVLQLLMLHSNKMTDRAQNEILNLIVLLSTCNKFKAKMTIDYYENFRLLFSPTIESIELEPSTSKLLNLNDQLVFIEESSYHAFKTAKIHLFLKAIKDLVTLHIVQGEFKGPSKLIATQAFQCLRGFLRCPTVAQEFFKSETHTSQFFDIFYEIEKHRLIFNTEFTSQSLSPQEFQEREVLVQNNLTVEKHCILVLKDIAGCLSELDESIKIEIYPLVLRSICLKIRDLNEDYLMTMRFTDCTLERSLALFFVSYLFFEKQEGKIKPVDFDKNKFDAICARVEAIPPGEQGAVDFAYIWRQACKSVCKARGFIAGIGNRLWSFYGPVAEMVEESYTKMNIGLLDKILVQLAAITIERSEMLMLACTNYIDLRLSCIGALQRKAEAGEEGAEAKLKVILAKFVEDGTMAKLGLNLNNVFSCLVDIFTNETAVPYLMQMLVQANKPFYRPDPIDLLNSKFYERSLRESIQHVMLALCPTTISKLMKMLNVFCNNDELIESVIDACCDIDRSNQIVKLKAKVKEDLISSTQKNKRHPWQVILLFAASPASATKVQEGLEETIVDMDYLTVPQPLTQFTTFLRRQSELVTEKKAIGYNNSMILLAKKIVLFPKLNFLTPMLQWLLLSSGMIKWSNTNPNAFTGFSKIAEACLQVEPDQSGFIQAFLSRVPKFSNEDEALQTDCFESKEPAPHVLPVEKGSKQDDKGTEIKARFEAKRTRIIRRMKEKQTTFFSGVINPSDSQGAGQNSTQTSDLLCSVSRESLKETETYYMYVQCHMTNIREQIKVELLNDQISESVSEGKGEVTDFDELLNLRDNCLKGAMLMNHLFLTQCGHFIAEPSMAASGDRQKNYASIEYQCSICRKPSNLLLPLYASQVFEHLNSSTSFTKDIPKDDLLKSFIYQLNLREKDPLALGWWRNPTCYSKHSLAHLDLESEALSQVQAKLMQYMDYYYQNTRACLNIVVIREHSFEEQITDSLCELLRYTEVIGLVPAVKSFGCVYHSLYTTLRLRIINEAERYKDTPGIIEHCSPSQLYFLLKTFLKSCQDPAQFKDLDLNSIMCRLLSLTAFSVISETDAGALLVQISTLLVSLKYKQLAAAKQISGKWSEVKYDVKHADIVQSILKILRMAALFRYIQQYPRISTSSMIDNEESRIFDKILTANIANDDKEIEYLIIFTDIVIDDRYASVMIDACVLMIDDAVRKCVMQGDEEKGVLEKGVLEKAVLEKGEIVKRAVVCLADAVHFGVLDGSAENCGLVPSSNKKILLSDSVAVHLESLGKELIFKFQKFPENFYSFYQAFIPKNCELCKEKNKLALCLLCGQVFCVRTCTEDQQEDNRGLIGNAAVHSFKYHAGTCIYIVSDDGDLIVYEGVRVFVFASLFTNKYGQSFDTEVKSYGLFEPYNLNKEKLAAMHSSTLMQQVIYEIIDNNNKHDLHYINHFF